MIGIGLVGSTMMMEMVRESSCSSRIVMTDK